MNTTKSMNLFNKVFSIEKAIYQPNLWMKNILTYDKVNKYISLNTGIDYNLLNKLFLESVEQMQIEEWLIDTALTLREKWIKIALITDNMDVFNTITIKKHNLDKVFPLIINSCDYWYIKTEKNWLLFDIAMEKIWEKDINKTLMIDNSSNIYNLYTAKWWNCYKYKEYEEFSIWAKENLNI